MGSSKGEKGYHTGSKIIKEKIKKKTHKVKSLKKRVVRQEWENGNGQRKTKERQWLQTFPFHHIVPTLLGVAAKENERIYNRLFFHWSKYYLANISKEASMLVNSIEQYVPYFIHTRKKTIFS